MSKKADTKEITIKELQSLLNKAESDIDMQLAMFEAKTGLKVTGLSFDRDKIRGTSIELSL